MITPKLHSLISQIPNKNYKTLNLITIDSTKILSNYDYFKKLSPTTDIWPVLKSNSYGHGYTNIAKILKKRQFEYLIVDSYHEALIIRQVNPNQKILLIGSILPVNFQHINFKNITLTIQDLTSLKEFIKLNKRVTIHLKINTGMNRQGIEVNEIKKYINLIKKHPKIHLEGVFSHLADADNHHNSYTNQQLKLFDQAIKVFKDSGLKPKFVHLSATAGVLKIQHFAINALRLGIGLYGYNPLDHKDSCFNLLNRVQPALTLTSTITKIRHVKKGAKFSYNLTHTLKEDSYIATIPIGYYDGLDRRLSNSGFIKYKNNFYPIIGRVCMNIIIVNFGKVKPKLFDTIEIISDSPKDKNSILNIAKTCETIPYDILVHLSPSTRRKII